MSDLIEVLQELLQRADILTPIRIFASKIENDPTNADSPYLGQLKQHVARDIGRIEHAEIASFMHPNEAGARRYAERIYNAYVLHQEFSVRSALTRQRAQVGSVANWFASHGLNGTKGVRQLAAVSTVQSVALQLQRCKSDLLPVGANFVLSLGETLSFRIPVPIGSIILTENGPPMIQVAEYLFAAFDTDDTDLSEITEISLDGPVVNSLKYAGMQLYINGVTFFTASLDAGTRSDSQIRYSFPDRG
jgi:hypothetical protein